MLPGEFGKWFAKHAKYNVCSETAAAAWEAALDAMEAKLPAEVFESDPGYPFDAPRADGWNICRIAVREQITALRSPPSQPSQPSERGTGGGA